MGMVGGVGNMAGTGPGGSMTVLSPTPGCGCGTPSDDTSCCVGGPESNCGGVGSACCEGAGSMITDANWSYVGDGYGDSVATCAYQYVGLGAGPYKKEVIVTPYGCKLKPACICLSLLALPLLFFLL